MVQGFGIGILTKQLSEPSVLLLSLSVSGSASVFMVGGCRCSVYFKNTLGNSKVKSKDFEVKKIYLYTVIFKVRSLWGRVIKQIF